MTLFGRVMAVVCLSFGLLGCSGSIPSLAPTSVELLRKQDQDWDVYMVKVTPRVVNALASYEEPGFPSAFRVGTYTPTVILKPGDTVGVTVYENNSQPLFGNTTVPPLMTGVPGQPSPQASTLPLQIIEADGRITVPYVGRVRVAGKTPNQAAALIQEGLDKETVRPQVVVSLVNNNSNTVAIGGEVNKAGLMPLTLRGERLLDAVAWAGGPKWPAIQVDVRLMRGNTVASVPLSQVMSNPADNIAARPDDSITLVRNPKTYLVMGAAQKVSTFTFDYEKVTVAQALAQAGGGIDTISNLRGVYLFREEPGPFARRVLESDNNAVDATYVKNRAEGLAKGQKAPIVYQIDMTQVDGYFLAQQITLRDDDIVLVTTAEATQFLKIMQIIRSLTGAYYDIKRTSYQP